MFEEIFSIDKNTWYGIYCLIWVLIYLPVMSDGIYAETNRFKMDKERYTKLDSINIKRSFQWIAGMAIILGFWYIKAPIVLPPVLIAALYGLTIYLRRKS